MLTAALSFTRPTAPSSSPSAGGKPASTIGQPWRSASRRSVARQRVGHGVAHRQQLGLRMGEPEHAQRHQQRDRDQQRVEVLLGAVGGDQGDRQDRSVDRAGQAGDGRVPHRTCSKTSRVSARKESAFLFDLDGTLIDSVYQHVIAWREALEAGRPVARRVEDPPPHRDERRPVRHRPAPRAGRPARRRDGGAPARPAHARPTSSHYASVRPLPGATELLGQLTEQGIPWTIATSGAERSAGRARALLGLRRRRADGHPRPGPLRQARPRPVPHRGGPARGRHRRRDRRRRQRLGPARGAACRRARRRPAVRAATAARS